jgi:hypothetical protein
MLLTENIGSFLDELEGTEDEYVIDEDFSIEEIAEMLEYLDQEELNTLGEALLEEIESMLGDEENIDEKLLDEVMSGAQRKKAAFMRKKKFGKRISSKNSRNKATRAGRKGQLRRALIKKKRREKRNLAKVKRSKKIGQNVRKSKSYVIRPHKK